MGQECKSVDLEVGLVGPESVQELRKLDTSQPSRDRRIYLALLAIGLCAAAAIFFSVHNLVSLNIRKCITDLNNYNSTFSNNTVEWRDDQQLSYFGGGLKLDRNEIVIPRTGLYFVYSQVSFHINCHANPHLASLDKHYLSHQVFRTTHRVSNKRLLLLSAKRSGCEYEPALEDSGKRWYSTINQGAIFQLDKGDRLGTETEPMAHVASETGQTYFGVFAL
ncbi:hypothetical protein ACEWY4_024153 [Coilia grayii]|uniref:Tumor necrosis factor n=1 Tax=Coilia grayii TaxID=363190 RepID=A0ABD1IZI5_9TELE